MESEQPAQPSDGGTAPALRDGASSWDSTRPDSGRPKWLSAVTISAIVMGCMFGCCGIAGIGGLVVGRVMSPAAMQAPTRDERIANIQKQYMERNAAFQARIFPLAMGSGLLALAHAVALAIAGVLAYRVRAIGRRMLATLCIAGIAIELVSGYIGVYVATEQNAVMGPLMEEMMTETVKDQPNQSAQQKRALDLTRGFMAAAFKAGNVFSWLTVIGFFVVKSAYYLASALYLRRPEVAAYYE